MGPEAWGDCPLAQPSSFLPHNFLERRSEGPLLSRPCQLSLVPLPTAGWSLTPTSDLSLALFFLSFLIVLNLYFGTSMQRLFLFFVFPREMVSLGGWVLRRYGRYRVVQNLLDHACSAGPCALGPLCPPPALKQGPGADVLLPTFDLTPKAEER